MLDTCQCMFVLNCTDTLPSHYLQVNKRIRKNLLHIKLCYFAFYLTLKCISPKIILNFNKKKVLT